MKKILSFVLAASMVCLGFTACSDSSDSNNTALILMSQQKSGVQDPYSSCYGIYKGTMTVTMGGNPITQEVNYEISADKLSDKAGKYGDYTKILWLTNSDGKIVVAGQSDSTFTKKGELSTENYTSASSCYIVFKGDGTAVYTVPAMAAMGGVATITKE